MASRVRAEIQRWRAAWQQVETLLDRVDGARDEDAPEALRCEAAHAALAVVEDVRFMEWGASLQDKLGPTSATTPRTIAGSDGTLKSTYEDRAEALPGGLEIEAAIAGLSVNEDGKPEDPALALLLESGDLFSVFDEDDQEEMLQAPLYVFGALRLSGTAPTVPGLPGLRASRYAQVPVAEGSGDGFAGSDAGRESLFPVNRRKTAADEGFAELLSMRTLYETRRDALSAGSGAQLSQIRDLIDSDPATAEFILLLTGLSLQGRVQTLDEAKAALEEEEPEDELAGHLRVLRDAVAEQQRRIDDLRVALEALRLGQDGAEALVATRRSRLHLVFSGVDDAPAVEEVETALAGVLDAYSEAVAMRTAYPDGSLRGLRTLEVALLRLWRSRAPWFAQRKTLVLDRWLWGFLARFVRNLRGVVQDGHSALSDTLHGVVPASPVAAQNQYLVVPDGIATWRVRPGEIAVVGGARPALLRMVGPDPLDRSRVRISPARISLASSTELTGSAGMLDEAAPLGRTLTPVPGSHLVRGTHPAGPAADAISQQIVAWWGELALVLGAHRLGFSLPAPFDPGLSVAVYAHDTLELAPRSAQLVLVDPPRDGDTLLVATPGEVLLLRGRDAEDRWWQGVIEVNDAQLTTLRALGLPSLAGDPDDPCCVACAPDEPVALLSLISNTVEVALERDITVHRDFRGFGTPSLAVGVELPPVVDPDTETLRRTPGGAFSASGGGERLRRDLELRAAAARLDQWVPPR